MTLPELFALFDAHAMKQRRRYEVATLTAWQTANLMRTDPKKRLPKLSKLFAQFGEKAPQTRRELVGALTHLSQLTGIPLQRVSAHG